MQNEHIACSELGTIARAQRGRYSAVLTQRHLLSLEARRYCIPAAAVIPLLRQLLLLRLLRLLQLLRYPMANRTYAHSAYPGARRVAALPSCCCCLLLLLSLSEEMAHRAANRMHAHSAYSGARRVAALLSCCCCDLYRRGNGAPRRKTHARSQRLLSADSATATLPA